MLLRVHPARVPALRPAPLVPALFWKYPFWGPVPGHQDLKATKSCNSQINNTMPQATSVGSAEAAWTFSNKRGFFGTRAPSSRLCDHSFLAGCPRPDACFIQCLKGLSKILGPGGLPKRCPEVHRTSDPKPRLCAVSSF